MLGGMTDGGLEGLYSQGGLLSRILAGLTAAGKDSDNIDPNDLMMVDEFHTLGPMATAALGMAAGIGATDHVLDAGCGIGGPARHLARGFGCRVTGVDLTPEFVDVANELTRRCGLADRVEVVEGDACAMTFPAGSFDVAWTQHASMNIPDKAALYGELRRVVKPGGRLAFFDILAGPAGPLHFPVPWSTDETWNFLEPVDSTRALVEGAGFEVTLWEDVTEQAAAFFAMAAAATAGPDGPGPLGIHLLISDPATKLANFGRNLAEDRARAVRCVATACQEPR